MCSDPEAELMGAKCGEKFTVLAEEDDKVQMWEELRVLPEFVDLKKLGNSQSPKRNTCQKMRVFNIPVYNLCPIRLFGPIGLILIPSSI